MIYYHCLTYLKLFFDLEGCSEMILYDILSAIETCTYALKITI